MNDNQCDQEQTVSENNRFVLKSQRKNITYHYSTLADLALVHSTAKDCISLKFELRVGEGSSIIYDLLILSVMIEKDPS